MMYFDEALRVLLANKIRTLLTITGLIIGVGAVIAIQVLGDGMSGAVEGLFGGLTDNSFIVQPNPQQADFRKAAFHLRDLVEIQRTVPNILEAVPLAFMRQVVRAGHAHSPGSISTASSKAFAAKPFLYGRNFTDDAVSEQAAVCVLSFKIYEKLYPGGGDPTGESIHLGNRRYVIAGILAKPKSGIVSANFNGDVSIPYTTFERDFLKGRAIFAGAFYVYAQSQMNDTESAVIKALKKQHRNAQGLEYITIDKKTLNSTVGGFFAVLTLVVAMIGAVSLVVAGIGIMNIMLVSVTERTREIGIRKAIGARQGQILAQFFIEALLLCGLGCGIGLALGLGIGYTVNSLFIVKLTGTITAIPWLQAAVIAVTFASVVTVAFGLYPAFRAARLDPIEALRYE
ncbi:MAG: ABC transporter permease [Vulcanimicrobiaceae bacterium]